MLISQILYLTFIFKNKKTSYDTGVEFLYDTVRFLDITVYGGFTHDVGVGTGVSNKICWGDEWYKKSKTYLGMNTLKRQGFYPLVTFGYDFVQPEGATLNVQIYLWEEEYLNNFESEMGILLGVIDNWLRDNTGVTLNDLGIYQ